MTDSFHMLWNSLFAQPRNVRLYTIWATDIQNLCRWRPGTERMRHTLEEREITVCACAHHYNFYYLWEYCPSVGACDVGHPFTFCAQTLASYARLMSSKEQVKLTELVLRRQTAQRTGSWMEAGKTSTKKNEPSSGHKRWNATELSFHLQEWTDTESKSSHIHCMWFTYMKVTDNENIVALIFLRCYRTSNNTVASRSASRQRFGKIQLYSIQWIRKQQ